MTHQIFAVWSWKLVQRSFSQRKRNARLSISKIRIISIWKFGFSDFRDFSFSISHISFVYAYTKEIWEMLKEKSRKSENPNFHIEIIRIFDIDNLAFLFLCEKLLCTNFQLHTANIWCVMLTKTVFLGMKILKSEYKFVYI